MVGAAMAACAGLEGSPGTCDHLKLARQAADAIKSPDAAAACSMRESDEADAIFLNRIWQLHTFTSATMDHLPLRRGFLKLAALDFEEDEPRFVKCESSG